MPNGCSLKTLKFETCIWKKSTHFGYGIFNVELFSRWLTPVILLIDLYEKVATASARRAAMIKVTSHTWKWFDDRSVRWCVYNSSNNKTIDEAYRAGEPSVHFTAGRRKYSIQFAAMMQVSIQKSCLLGGLASQIRLRNNFIVAD